MENQPVLDVVCLCAAWCSACRAYEAVFQQCAQAMPAHRFRWIDIEDEATLVGEPDIDTFPTLLVAHEGRVLFAGPVLPRLADIQRLVMALEVPDAVPQAAVLPEMRALAVRLSTNPPDDGVRVLKSGR
jgi:thiol-disulfide isomerase/thioredoxin